MKRLKVFMSGMLAGICVAIGGTVFLLHADGWQENKINRQSRNGALDGFDRPEVLADGTLPSDEVIPYPHPLPQEKALPPRVAKSQKEHAT